VLVAERLGRPLSIRMRDVLRVLGTLLEPAPVDGKARRGAETDPAMVLQWESDFLAEAGLPPEHLPDDVTLAAMLQRLWLWEVDGVPVAMAAHAPIVQTPGGAVGRIGPVYTVPTARRRGIGAAVTSVVARHLLEQGCTAMLYADAANPTSNGVYERLGFQAVGEHIEADLLEPTGTSARWEKRIRS
jgi:predicted GNAT family acetyltransferase